MPPICVALKLGGFSTVCAGATAGNKHTSATGATARSPEINIRDIMLSPELAPPLYP